MSDPAGGEQDHLLTASTASLSLPLRNPHILSRAGLLVIDSCLSKPSFIPLSVAPQIGGQFVLLSSGLSEPSARERGWLNGW